MSSLLPLAVLLFATPVTQSPDPQLISGLDELSFSPPKAKAHAELVDGKVGRAVRFTFDAGAQSMFFTSKLRGTPAWDRAAGFSFWVKGEGSNQFGGLQFIYNEDYALRYDYAFPTRAGEWTKITVAWQDLIPVLPGPNAKILDAASGQLPSKLAGPWVGKWWYWGDYPAQG